MTEVCGDYSTLLETVPHVRTRSIALESHNMHVTAVTCHNMP